MNSIFRNTIDFDWMTLVLLLSLIILALTKYLFKGSFFTFLILPLNNKYIKLNKKKGKLLHGFHIAMTLFQLLNTALFVFVTMTIFKKKILLAQSEWFVIFAIGLLLFLLLKIVLQLGAGYFFENHQLMTELIFEKASYFNYGGFISFIGNVLAIYVFPNLASLFYIIFLLFLIINGIGIVKIIRNYQKLIVGNAFYFILYLCTLEISPIAIIISYLNS